MKFHRQAPGGRTGAGVRRLQPDQRHVASAAAMIDPITDYYANNARARRAKARKEAAMSTDQARIKALEKVLRRAIEAEQGNYKDPHDPADPDDPDTEPEWMYQARKLLDEGA